MWGSRHGDPQGPKTLSRTIDAILDCAHVENTLAFVVPNIVRAQEGLASLPIILNHPQLKLSRLSLLSSSFRSKSSRSPPICRICHGDGSPSNGPLISPCKCSGTMNCFSFFSVRQCKTDFWSSMPSGWTFQTFIVRLWEANEHTHFALFRFLWDGPQELPGDLAIDGQEQQL